MTSGGDLQAGGGGGGEKKHPQFPSMGDGDRVTGRVQEGDVGVGSYEYLRANADIQNQVVPQVVRSGR